MAFNEIVFLRRPDCRPRENDTLAQAEPDRDRRADPALGHHCYESGAWERAFAYLGQAGRAAAERSAHREAVASFAQALAAFEHLPASRELSQKAIDVRFDLRQSLLVLEELPRMLDCLQVAEDQARSIDDEARIGRAAALLTHVLALLGRHEEAVETGRRARGVAHATDDFSLRILSSLYLGHTHYFRGDFAAAEELLRANVSALVGDLVHERFGLASSVSVISRVWLAFSLAERGEFDEALVQAHEAVARSERSDNPWSLFHAHAAAGRVYVISVARRGCAREDSRESARQR